MDIEKRKKILDLLKAGNYLSPIEFGLLNSGNNEFIRLDDIPIDVLRDNLTIGIRANMNVERNVDDLKKLLSTIENTNDNVVYSLDIKLPNKAHHSIYFNEDLSSILGSIW